VKEACGVFGVYAPGRSAAHLTFDGIYALQHRGQESAGMAVSDGEMVTVMTGMGLVSSVFDEPKLKALPGHLAIGHTRYSTHGSSNWTAAQPVHCSAGRLELALGHNGNLTNTEELAELAGMLPGIAATDSELVAELVANATGTDGDATDLRPGLRKVLPRVEGAFSLVLLDERHLYGARDPHGFRPLCLGRFGPAEAPEGWVLASESPALDVIGATFEREVAPGELVMIDADGPHSEFYAADTETSPKLCIFEFVYFARPDTHLYGQEVHGTRRRMGELLADQSPVEADMVMGVPDSGVPAAEGYARRSGIPYGQGLVKNRYIGRTFIEPDSKSRIDGVRRKLNPLRENIAGKRVVVVDDSIVRGTTPRAMVQMLREAGATEVHLRISSPPFKWPCFYGIDTPTRNELLASTRTVDEIRDYLGADSVDYLRLENLKSAIGVSGAGFCDACMTGSYPVAVRDAAGRQEQSAVKIRTNGIGHADPAGAEPALQGALPGV
jgi:amidophosphoribosyltransferase